MISVIIPAYNEESAVTASVEQVQRVLSGVDHEIVVVDDGSVDTTSVRARDAGAQIFRHPHNLGYGAALKTGIMHASGDTIVITDADGTYPSEFIPVLLKEFKGGFDMVVGARTGQQYRESVIKSPLRMILKVLVEFTTGRRVPDVNSGLRVFSRQEVLPYLDHLCNTFSFTTSLTLAYMMTGKFVTYVQIPYHKRVGRTKVRLFRDALRTMQYIVEAILYYNPLKMFLLLTLFVALLGVMLFASGLVLQSPVYFLGGVTALVGTVIVFCMGLLAELLRQLMIKP